MGGLTMSIVLFYDIFVVFTLHIYVCYAITAAVYAQVLWGMGSLWRLFRGEFLHQPFTVFLSLESVTSLRRLVSMRTPPSMLANPASGEWPPLRTANLIEGPVAWSYADLSVFTAAETSCASFGRTMHDGLCSAAGSDQYPLTDLLN